MEGARLTADILAVCDTLGVSDGTKYLRDPQCLSSAKDLILYLRRDSSDHSTRRLLGDSHIIQKDLVPIFKLGDCSEDLSEVVLRLMVNLTTPPLLLYEQGVPKEKDVQHHVMQMTKHLQGYKKAYADEDFWAVIKAKLEKLIENMELILEVQKLTVERILILIRNVLHVPTDPAEEMRNDDDANVHDQILWVMQQAGVLDLLLFIASSDSTREFCLHIVEILTLIFREQSGEQLAKTKLTESYEDVKKDAEEFARTVKAENAKRCQEPIKARSFGGTFVVRGLKAASGNDQICHKPIQSLAELSMDSHKKLKKTPKNRAEIVQNNLTRRSTVNMRLLLKEFCTEFLNGEYNHLMRIVKDRLTRERGQENDEIYYLGAMRFFMEFNRYADSTFTVARVSETMSITTFHYVQGLITNFHELMVTDKDRLSLWSKRAHMALRAYQELLSSLHIMDKTPETTDAARVIQSSIFYLPEYRELCLGLLTNYEGRKLSRNYFCDLVETNHIFLKMLEEFTKEKNILVRGKKRGRKNRGKKGKRARTEKKDRKKPSEDEWDQNVESGLIEYLDQPSEAVEMIPFDAASDVPIDEQRETALSRIATHLGKKEFNEAVSLFRAARDVWPDDDQVSKETEISSLKSIFLTASPLQTNGEQNEDLEEDEGDDEAEIEDDEEEYEERYEGTARESEFDFRGFMERFANPKIIANYGNLFRHFDAVSQNAFHCVMKMFHRLVFDMDYPSLICQASIFRTFQRLLKMAKFQPEYGEAIQFFKHFWPKFVKLATVNPKMFAEILFWKTGKDVTEIQEGYIPYGASSSQGAKRKKNKNVRGTVTEDEEHEISVLSAEYSQLPLEKGRKQVDWINERLIKGPKVKKVLQNYLKDKGLLAARLKVSKKPGEPLTRRKKGAGLETLENGDGIGSDGEQLPRPIVYSGSESDLSTSEFIRIRRQTAAALESDTEEETAENRHEFDPDVEAAENGDMSDADAVGNGRKSDLDVAHKKSAVDPDSDTNETAERTSGTVSQRRRVKNVIVSDSDSD